ncbi:MAG: DUF6883 domain-containing protein [Hyphomicrobium sp.]|jgi:hypothetical protein
MADRISPIVFLFDADADDVSSCYGDYFNQAFLRALSHCDPLGRTNTAVRLGDVMVSSLARRVSQVSASDRGTQRTDTCDEGIYQTIVWDLVDALTQQWHTVNLDAFPLQLARRNTHCIFLSTFNPDFSAPVDQKLRRTRGYLGAIYLDFGNPIQRTLFYELLIDIAVIVGGQVVVELSFEGYPESLFSGSDKFKPRGEKRVACGELSRHRPPLQYTGDVSERGEISLNLYRGKSELCLQERVTTALAHMDRANHAQPYSFTVTEDARNPLEADLTETKFVKYLLSKEHEHGRHKAKFYAEALGIGPEDWRYLAAQFHDGLKQAELKEFQIKSFPGGFKVSFNAVVPVKGLNDRIVDIDTNWIMEPGKQPRLSTAIPAKRRDCNRGDVGPVAVVSRSLRGNERWVAIFEMASQAGREAARAAIPTPMKVEGFPVIFEGECGFARVRMKDGRHSFAKWLIAHGHAYHRYRSGTQIFADVDSQSIERATAYAKAFARILLHNGIPCEVQSRLD